MAPNRQTLVPSPLAASLASAAISLAASCGPRTDLDPSARAQFSSKSKSVQSNSTSNSTANTTPNSRSNPASASTASAVPFANPTLAQPAKPTQQPAVKEPGSVVPPQAVTTSAPVTTSPPVTPTATATTPVSSALLNEPPEAAVSNEARQILVQASSNPWAALRAHALEASIGHPSLLSEMAPKALVDENRGVRFVACMSIAEMRDARFNPLVAPLLSDPSASVRAAAMLALSRGGQRVNFTPLADMLADNDPEIRANAYLVLGELGNESAIPLIRESLGRGMKLVNPLRVRLVDLAAAEALVKLGDEKEVEPIRAALFAPPEQGELTIVACDSVRRLKDEVARPMLERIVSARGSAERSPEIRLAACRALHALGSPGAPLAVAKEYAQHPDARIRAQSTVLLGEIGSPDARALLSGLLHDADPTVQVAAAGGLDPEAP